jgi:hypothetical protein
MNHTALSIQALCIVDVNPAIIVVVALSIIRLLSFYKKHIGDTRSRTMESSLL